jgi:hypothetical protein
MDVTDCSVLSNIQPFDLVLFRGNDVVSQVISAVQTAHVGTGEFTHVGVVVDKSVLPKLHAGEMYIWESTWSGDVVNVETGEKTLGVQVRKVDDLIVHYDGKIAIAKLKQPMRDKINLFGIEQLHMKYVNKSKFSCNWGLCGLLSAVVPCLRRGKKKSNDMVFCSQFAAIIYQTIGVLDRKYDPAAVVPMDFLGYDQDDLPLMFEEPKYIK